MMKLLLDENVPAKLKFRLLEEDILTFTIRDVGWTGKKNGELLRLIIENNFSTFLIFDTSLCSQQNFRHYQLQVLVLVATDNTYARIMKSVGEIVARLAKDWVGAETLKLN